MSEAKSSPLVASRKLEEETENVVEGSSRGHDSVESHEPAKHDEHESTGDQDTKVDHGALSPEHHHEPDPDHHEHGKLRGKSSSDGSKAGGSSVKRPSGGPRNDSDSTSSTSSSSEESEVDSSSEDSADDEHEGVKTRPKLRGQAVGGAVKAADTSGPKGPTGPKTTK